MTVDHIACRLWESSLGPRQNDSDQQARERLRHSWISAREKAAFLAGEIARDLPDFTVHDATHLDALWETAQLVAGDDFAITPLEAWVLGLSILLHDIGMGLAAYPGGLEELKSTDLWKDLIAMRLLQRLGRAALPGEMANPPTEIEQEATRESLRVLHAKRASDLALVSWSSNGTDFHLIEDDELRTNFGGIAGRIAQSHHHDVGQLQSTLGPKLGAPGFLPQDWTLDPVKIACLLRVADACHLDSRRAPSFLMALRKPVGLSRDHWVFQNNLLRPQLAEGSALTFTSSRPFVDEEADAWFLCAETLEMVDRELRGVDELLCHSNRQQLKASRVLAVGDNERMSTYIKTENWEPLDSRLKVGDVPGLVEKLGGESLYGPNELVTIRELIQNAADAIRARRINEDHPADWGDITVRLGNEGSRAFLEVEDAGSGMSKQAMIGPLLDFGTSYWNTQMYLTEMPGLAAKGFMPSGKYGIGFYSVFMLGNEVQVFSRRCEAARSETQVLEFRSGTRLRPLIKLAPRDKWILDGGTRVRIWLAEEPYSEDGFVTKLQSVGWTLELALASLCPSLDANLFLEEVGIRKAIVHANDWLRLPGKELIERVWGIEDLYQLGSRFDAQLQRDLEKLASNVEEIKDEAGVVVGRAALYDSDYRLSHATPDRTEGIISVGGLMATRIDNIQGILTGVPLRASRDVALPAASLSSIAEWTTNQAKVLPNPQVTMSSEVHSLGGQLGQVPVALVKPSEQNTDHLLATLLISDLAEWARDKHQVRLLFYFDVMILHNFELDDDVMICDIDPTNLFRGHTFIYGFRLLAGDYWPPISRVGTEQERLLSTLMGPILDELSLAWESTPTEILSCSTLVKSDDEFDTTKRQTFGKDRDIPLSHWRITTFRRPRAGQSTIADAQ